MRFLSVRDAEDTDSTLQLSAFVRKQKHGSSEVGFQRGLVIVAAEDTALPDQQVGILPGKFFPIRAAAASHAFADQEKICAGDCFVIQLRSTTRFGEAFQGRGESLQRLQDRILAQISKCQPDMVSMVERVVSEGIRFEAKNEVVVSHLRMLGKPHRPVSSPCRPQLPRLPPSRSPDCLRCRCHGGDESQSPARKPPPVPNRRGWQYAESKAKLIREFRRTLESVAQNSACAFARSPGPHWAEETILIQSGSLCPVSTATR